ncbi:hypothetical protein OIV83_001116 [Microbotryomycetes sp. JL201]|nr:hypothetical protein OIV83_001116 [Microbotryomycetes sp. JL201]
MQTLKHAHKLVKDLDDRGEHQFASLKQRLLQADNDVARISKLATRPRPAAASTAISDNDSGTNSVTGSSSDLDFLAPSVPLFPTSSISPSSSPAPLAGTSSSPYKQPLQPPPSSYSPIPFSTPVDSNQYSPYGQRVQDSEAPQWGIDTSVANRNRATSSASRVSEYNPDDYSPSRTRHPDAGQDDRYAPPVNTADSFDGDDHGKDLSRRGRDDQDDDPESGAGPTGGDGLFGASSRGRQDDFDHDDDDNEFDPEAGATIARRRSDTKTSASSMRSSSRQSTMPPPPPRKSSTGSITTNQRDQLLGSGLRQRPRAGSNLSTSSGRQNDNDLTSTAAGATTSDLLSHHHDMQNSLMSSLTQLSGQLKTSSLAFQDNLEKDKQVMKDAQTKLERNHDKVVKQGSRLGVVKKKARGTTCWTIMAVTVVLFAWVVMFFLIKVT